jgi:predicted metal-dependent hydrolase
MNLEYRLIRSGRKTLALIITKEGKLQARAPLSMPIEAIEAFILKKQNWIEEKIEQIKSRKAAPKTYIEGDSFLYLGKSYELAFSDEIKLHLELKDKLCIASRYQHRVKYVLAYWYRSEAYKFILARVQHYSALMGCFPKDVKISNALHRWGSCSIKGNVNLSWRLIMAPLEIIDYVVVHELVHLGQHDHSKAFWAKVEQIIPDYKKRRKWLKENGAKLIL